MLTELYKRELSFDTPEGAERWLEEGKGGEGEFVVINRDTSNETRNFTFMSVRSEQVPEIVTRYKVTKR